ncbi:MAG TPA: phosphoribosylanthranilate isomerase [Rhizomicrobium sp.]
MAPLVKICGLNSAEAADAAVRAGADFAGLMFHVGSPRNLPIDVAAMLAERLRGRARIVAVFADARDEDMQAAVAAIRPDFIQLHGLESPERVASIHGLFGAPIIKAVAIAEPSDLNSIAKYEDVAEMFLFDAKAPAGATREGGHGAAFDWQLLKGRNFTRPWLLAGGLNTENVARAIEISNAPGVDVSSGVETAPGVKCADMIRDFVSAARATHMAVAP